MAGVRDLSGLYGPSPPPPLGVQCNFFLGEGFHPSSYTRPAETNRMADSAREPTRHSMCTCDTWWHRDSMEPELTTS